MSVTMGLILIVAVAVAVFIASCLVHMVFKWHASDFRRLPDEDAVRAAIRAVNAAPGQYVLPHCADMKAMESAEMKQKYAEGPIGFLLLKPAGAARIGAALLQWFVFNLVVAAIALACALHLFAAYQALAAAHVVAVISFLSYGGSAAQAGIWMGKPWRSVAKEWLDALFYALVSAAVVFLLWPN